MMKSSFFEVDIRTGMATHKTFLSDYDFDDVTLMEKVSQEEIPNDQSTDHINSSEPEIVVPTFSENDIEIARKEGFESGKEAGISETLLGIENKILDVMRLLEEQISELYRKQAELNERLESDAISLINSINKKIFPSLCDRLDLDEAILFSEEMLDELKLETHITIRVSEEIYSTFDSRIKEFVANKQLDGKLVVESSNDISTGSCQIEWTGGTAERNVEEIASKIEKQLVNAMDNLKGLPENNDEIVHGTQAYSKDDSNTNQQNNSLKSDVETLHSDDTDLSALESEADSLTTEKTSAEDNEILNNMTTNSTEDVT